MMSSILIVEDDITFGMMLKTWLGKKGFEVSSVSNIARARKHIESQTVDLVLSDLRLPDYEGIDLLKWMNDRGINIPLIIMTGYADIQSAVLAMKLGARDYIAKPVNPEELLKKISEALQTESSPAVPHSTARNSSNPKKGGSNSQDTSETNHSYLEGESDAAKQLYNYVGLVAPTNMSVLINGSSGTQQEKRQTVYCCRLRLYPQRTGSFRVFRSCERLFYGRTDGQNRSFRRSQRRHYLFR